MCCDSGGYTYWTMRLSPLRHGVPTLSSGTRSHNFIFDLDLKEVEVHVRITIDFSHVAREDPRR